MAVVTKFYSQISHTYICHINNGKMRSSDIMCEICNPLEGQKKIIQRRRRRIKETEKKRDKGNILIRKEKENRCVRRCL